MRMLMTVKIPNTDFNLALKNGTASKTISRILEECAAEAVYFTEEDGCRGAMIRTPASPVCPLPGERWAKP